MPDSLKGEVAIAYVVSKPGATVVAGEFEAFVALVWRHTKFRASSPS
jgi:hypothetical protein